MLSCGAETNDRKNTTDRRTVQIPFYCQNEQSGKQQAIDLPVKYSSSSAFIFQIIGSTNP